MKNAMQKLHGRCAFSPLVTGLLCPHMGLVIQGKQKGDVKMFIRPVWKLGRVLNVPHILREMDIPGDAGADAIGLYHAEFCMPSAIAGKTDKGNVKASAPQREARV